MKNSWKLLVTLAFISLMILFITRSQTMAASEGLSQEDLKSSSVEVEPALLTEFETNQQLDFIHLVDKKKRQGKLISTTKEKSYAYLAPLYYDHTTTICASV